MGPSRSVVNNQHPPTTGETREAWQFFKRKIASSLAEGKLIGNPNTNCPPQFFLMTSNRSFCPSPLPLVLSISIELFPSFFSMISKHRLSSTAPIYLLLFLSSRCSPHIGYTSSSPQRFISKHAACSHFQPVCIKLLFLTELPTFSSWPY